MDKRKLQQAIEWNDTDEKIAYVCEEFGLSVRPLSFDAKLDDIEEGFAALLEAAGIEIK